MKVNRSQWRDASAYDYMDELSVEGLAWECLRRNPDYQEDFARFLRSEDDKLDIEKTIADRWGLRFRCKPQPHQHHATCCLDARG